MQIMEHKMKLEKVVGIKSERFIGELVTKIDAERGW
jgi:hypothetical protein